MLSALLSTGLAIVFCVLCALHAFSSFDFWKKRGVLQVKVKYPIVGNILDVILKPLHQLILEQYNAFPDERYVGTYLAQKPVLLIRDPDLVECVLIKDYSYFSERGEASDPNTSLVTKHLLNVKGEHWKTMRAKLAPTFTSGKLKNMHSQVTQNAENLMTFLKKFDDGSQFETKDIISRFVMDVIASCVFGLDINTVNNPESEFRNVGLGIFRPSMSFKLLMVFRPVIRPVLKFFKIGIFPKKYEDFFVNSMKTTLDFRKTNNIVRNDYLHLMNELVNKDKEMVKNKEMSADDPHIFDEATLYSNAFVFFLAGYGATSSCICYALHSLAVHPNVQNRLFDEVESVVKKHNNEISYDAVRKMVFLDQVVSETLRLYPPGSAVNRTVTKEYKVPGSDLVLPVGTMVQIPMYALLHDPKYFSKPKTFRPERFDEENTIRKGVYFPFGDGPRMCIATRFAKLMTKVCLATVVLRYEILRCEKTQVPLSFERDTSTLNAEGGIWLAIKPR